MLLKVKNQTQTILSQYKTKNVEEVANENVVDTKTNIETDNNVTESSEDKINEIENSVNVTIRM